MHRMKRYTEMATEALSKLYCDDSDLGLCGLTESQRYSLMAGGKRIRPVLTLAFCELFGGKAEDALPYACALELIHTASLIHDDLPCIDDDELRRGRPTNHAVYGEATALLAADGMLMDAFGIVADNPRLSPEVNARGVSILSRAVGSRGLVGGEYMDVMGEGKRLSIDELRTMESKKTGALIKAAACLGALAGGVMPDEPRMQDAITYSESIGLAFQIVDDVLDVIGTAESLGKNPGSDLRDNKSTYLSYYTVDEALSLAKELTERAVSAVEKYEPDGFLCTLATHLCNRRY